MQLIKAIDLDNLHKYSNVDFSTISFNYQSYMHVAKLDYTKLCALIDVFDDVNKLGDIASLSFSEHIVHMMYNPYYTASITNKEKVRILFKLLQRGSDESKIYNFTSILRSMIDIISYTNDIQYLSKYSNAIINLFRLTNSEFIEMCNLDSAVIDTIRMLLLITKIRVLPQGVTLKSLPKYIILHKILLFYLYQ